MIITFAGQNMLERIFFFFLSNLPKSQLKINVAPVFFFFFFFFFFNHKMLLPVCFQVCVESSE